MPSLTYTFPYKVNSGLVMSAQEFNQIYLFGIDFRDENGNSYSDETKEYYIRNAQEYLEKELSLKMTRQVIQEDRHFNMKDYQTWGYLRTTYPVECALALKGFIGTTRQITYPASWLSARKTNDKETGYFRQINLVPGGSDNVDFTAQAVYSSLYPFFGYAETSIPNYFQVEYVTGFSTVPRDILNVVGKLAAIDVMQVLGDIGAIGAGLASQSLSIDGLSQSISSTASATSAALTARILQYRKELDKEIPKLRDRYIGVSFTSM